jgi:hypothetical protein
MADKCDGKDPIRLEEQCKAIVNKWDRGQCQMECWDAWDDIYGIAPLSYEVYVLTDPTRPMIIEFPPFLHFYHRPFYIGYGVIGTRAKRSANFTIQDKDNYNYKTKILKEIHARGGRAIPVIIGNFYTKQKAEVVERKLMNTIHISFQDGNSNRNLCEIPLSESDCNVIYKNPSCPMLLAC